MSKLAADVRGHHPVDQREREAQARLSAELARLDHPFDQQADPTHVTASAVVVGRRGVVLHRHRRLHRWLQPGGHLETGESPEQAVLRECLEETGLEVAHPETGPLLVHLDVHPTPQGHVHLDVRYLVRAPDEDPASAAGESQEVAWFGWEAAIAMADEALVGALFASRRLIDTSSPGVSDWWPITDEQREGNRCPSRTTP